MDESSCEHCACWGEVCTCFGCLQALCEECQPNSDNCCGCSASKDDSAEEIDT